MSHIEQPLISPVEAYFTPMAFDAARDAGATALLGTGRSLAAVDHKMRQACKRGLPGNDPARTTLIIHQTYPYSGRDTHFVDMGPDDGLVHANQLRNSPDSAHVLTPKAEIEAGQRAILEVQTPEFVGSLTERLVWCALVESPADARLIPLGGLKGFLKGWGSQFRESMPIIGMSNMRKAAVARKIGEQLPEALYLMGRGYASRTP